MRSFSFLMCEYFQEVVCVQNSHQLLIWQTQSRQFCPLISSSRTPSVFAWDRNNYSSLTSSRLSFVLQLVWEGLIVLSLNCHSLWFVCVCGGSLWLPVQGQDTHWQSCLVTGVAVTVTGISDLSCHVHGTIFRPSEVAARLSDTPFVSHIPTGWSFTSSSVSLSHFVFLYLFMSTNAGQLQDFLCLLLRLYNWVQTGHGHLSPLTHTDTHTRTDRQIVKYSSVNM